MVKMGMRDYVSVRLYGFESRWIDWPFGRMNNFSEERDDYTAHRPLAEDCIELIYIYISSFT